VQSEDEPYRITLQSNFIPSEDRCDTLFQRLCDFHPSIKVLKLDIDATIDYCKPGEVRKMISYQRTAPDDKTEDPVALGVDLRTATRHLPQSFYKEFLDESGERLSDDLIPFWRSSAALIGEPASSEVSIPIDGPSDSNLDDLPPKVIANIVEHLASMGPSRPFPPAEVKRPCACHTIGADFRRRWLSIKDSKLPEESTDPALSLSCVSRKLRQIAFDERPERMYTLGFCAEAMENVTYLPLAMRRNVT
jgi:hypothetical protein